MPLNQKDSYRQTHPPETHPPETLIVSGAAARKASNILAENYYYRDLARPEIKDVACADGPVENLISAVERITDKTNDPHTSVLSPAEIKNQELHQSGIKDISTRERYVIWSMLIHSWNEVVGYINFPRFFDDAGKKFTQHLRRLPKKRGNAKPMRDVVLDLRGNGGGLVQEADTILKSLHSHTAYRLQRHPDQPLPKTELRELKGISSRTWRNLIVLVDRNSASASNIVAGVLQDEGKAVIVGDKTNPKATQQITEELQSDPRIRLKYTNAKIRLMSGFDIQENGGVDPDISVDDILSGRLTHNENFDHIMFRKPILLDREFSS